MKQMPYLSPTSKLNGESITSVSACQKLIGSFVPASGLNQVNASPSQDLRSSLSLESFKYKSQRLALLYKFSVHPRETIRVWAENTLLKFTRDDERSPIIEEEYLDTIFPWAQSEPHFVFTPLRALQLTRHETITADMATFLVQFRHEAISAKLINYVLEYIPDHTAPRLPVQLDQLLRKITTTHLPNARRTIARNKNLNWRVLDDLLENGLPLHALDAISHVDWDLYSKHADRKQRNKLIKRIKLFAQHDPTVTETIENWKLD